MLFFSGKGQARKPRFQRRSICNLRDKDSQWIESTFEVSQETKYLWIFSTIGKHL